MWGVFVVVNWMTWMLIPGSKNVKPGFVPCDDVQQYSALLPPLAPTSHDCSHLGFHAAK